MSEQIKEISKIDEENQDKVKKPDMFKVLLHNDHYTTMEFVVEILMKVFQKKINEANRIMLDIHNKGIGVVGLFPYDIAASKVLQVKSMAQVNGFPLKCTVEKD